jgi:hypothetical protein
MRARKPHLLNFRVENHIEVVLSRLGYEVFVALDIVGIDHETEDAVLARAYQML